MSPLEKRAWLMLWGMCPPYLVYFAIQIWAPGWPSSYLARFAVLAAAAGVHAAVYVTGLAVFKIGERRDGLLSDERDLAIDARATRGAYFVLLAGAIVAGMMLPFSEGGWKIVNAALLAIVLAETARNALVVQGYRGVPRFAH